MDDTPGIPFRSRDESYISYDLSNAVFGDFPSCAPDCSPRRSCASSPARRKNMKRHCGGDKLSSPSVSLGSNACWLPLPKKRNLAQHSQRMELHQSTCLNLNMASQDSSESDLWILPDFDDWALDTARLQHPARNSHDNGEWAPYLRRAAHSNLERLRARLEGDGWAFVGGKYDEEKKALQEEASLSEESVDEEFDVVVLPTLRVS